MEQTMNIYYDEESDFLEITTGDISECFFDNKGDGIFDIVDKRTQDIVGVAIFSLTTRTQYPG